MTWGRSLNLTSSTLIETIPIGKQGSHLRLADYTWKDLYGERIEEEEGALDISLETVVKISHLDI